MMKLLTVMLITVIHFITAFGLSMYTFSAGMSRFDTNREAATIEVLAKAISAVLLCPVFLPMASFMGKAGARLFPGMLGYIPMFANSLVWGVSFTYLLGIAKKLRRRPNQAL